MAEISLCETGHSVCQKCKNQLNPSICPVCKKGFSRARNYALEDIAATTMFSCKHDGCDVHLEGKDMKNHQLTCPYKPEACVLSFTGCTWKGSRTGISKHIYNHHGRFIKDFCACQGQDFHAQLLFQHGHLFAMFGRSIDNYFEYVGMYIPLEPKDTAPAAEEFTISFLMTTITNYKLEMTGPCIKRCNVEEIFNSHKIAFAVDSLK